MRRRTALFMVVALVAVLLSPAFSPLPASAGPENPAGDEAAFVSMINSARQAQGIAPLQVDGQLTALARGWAAEMAGGACGGQRESDGRNKICHAGSLSAGVSADWVKLGENVGMGGEVNAVMQGFMNSSGHYKNLMDPAFTRVGVGVVWSDNGALYTTHRFMQVAGESAEPPPPPPADGGGAKPADPAPRSGGSSPRTPSAPPATDPPPPPTTTTTPPPVAEPSRVSVVLQALHSAAR